MQYELFHFPLTSFTHTAGITVRLEDVKWKPREAAQTVANRLPHSSPLLTGRGMFLSTRHVDDPCMLDC